MTGSVFCDHMWGQSGLSFGVHDWIGAHGDRSVFLTGDPSCVYGAYPGEFTEANLGLTAQYRSTGLSRVGGDDQIMCAAGRTGSADMGEQASVVGRGRLGVVKDIDGGCYRHESPGAFGCSVGRIRHLDADAVLGDRYRGDGKFIVIQ